MDANDLTDLLIVVYFGKLDVILKILWCRIERLLKEATSSIFISNLLFG